MATNRRNVRLASKAIGAEVRNERGDDLGTVEDLLIDLDTDGGVMAVIKFGGLIGFGEKTYAIPVQALRNDPDGKFVLSASVELIEKAPTFDADRFDDDYDDDATLNAVRDHYLRS